MQQTIYKCNICGSAEQTEAYRTDSKNFGSINLSFSESGNAGMPGIGGQGLTNFNERIDICKECQAKENSAQAQLKALFDSLKVL